MSDAFRFETFVDVHGNIFNEYLSSVVARLSKEDEEYKALQEKIEVIYEEYPKVLAVFDSETESELTEKETMPVIVRDLDDDATIIMVDSKSITIRQ